jgi:hypothetical protein
MQRAKRIAVLPVVREKHRNVESPERGREPDLTAPGSDERVVRAGDREHLERGCAVEDHEVRERHAGVERDQVQVVR